MKSQDCILLSRSLRRSLLKCYSFILLTTICLFDCRAIDHSSLIAKGGTQRAKIVPKGCKPYPKNASRTQRAQTVPKNSTQRAHSVFLGPRILRNLGPWAFPRALFEKIQCLFEEAHGRFEEAMGHSKITVGLF